MAEEQKGDEIQDILSDLDTILSDISTPAADAAAPPPVAAKPPVPKPPVVPPAAVPAAPPKPEPKPAPTPVAAKPPPPPLPDETIEIPISSLPPAPAKAPEPPKPVPAAPGMTIELSPRPAVPPAAKKTEPPRPAGPKDPLASQTHPPLEITMESAGGPSNPAPPAPAKAEPKLSSAVPPVAPAGGESKPSPAPPSPAPAADAPVPAAAPAVPPIGADDVPEKTPKEQIRRVAFVYTAEHAEKKDVLAKFMSSSAQTISKKPLYLRRVLYEEVGASADGKGILSRVESVKAVAVLGLLEGLPESKIRELTEVFSGAGILFRVVGPEEVQKRSLAVDLIVDMMLLSPES